MDGGSAWWAIKKICDAGDVLRGGFWVDLKF
jgi:hypothetical protein